MKRIKLTKNKIALVDDDDYSYLTTLGQWQFHTGGYAYIRIGPYKDRKSVYMHRVILKLQDRKIQVDHIDHNKLNNQKSNLRQVTNIQNQQNRNKTKGQSSYKGVWFDRKSNKWIAQIKISNKRLTLGTFLNEKKAALAYNQAATKYFREYASLNKV